MAWRCFSSAACCQSAWSMSSGVSTAARYLPASDEVGGDWYDVFELPHGRLGIAIGDVVGHGVRAAALMGQLRTALHAYAIEDHGPGRTLAMVDRFVDGMPGYRDRDRGLCGARSRNRRTAARERRTSAADRGWRRSGPSRRAYAGAAARRVSVRAFPGARNVSGRRGDAGVLHRWLGGAPRDSADAEHQRACRRCSRGVVGRKRRVSSPIEALVPVGRSARRRRDRRHATQRASGRVVYAAACRSAGARRVRRVLRRWLRNRGAGDQDTARITLSVNEACTNAIEHAYSPAPADFDLRASATEGDVTIVVSDAGRWRTARGPNRGHGLAMIDAAMDEVEINSGVTGTES